MIFILLPAYNEEKSFPPLMEKLKHVLEQIGKDFKILVCNDGSTDRTSEMLKEYSIKLPIEVIEHSINRGLGESSRDLFERVVEIGKEGDVIIRMDCDDTHLLNSRRVMMLLLRPDLKREEGKWVFMDTGL